MEASLKEKCRMISDREESTVSTIVITSALLNTIAERGEPTTARVGGKYDGVWTCYRKTEMQNLRIGIREIWDASLMKLKP